VPGQIFRPFSLGDVGQGHEHAVEARGRWRQCHCDQRRPPVSLQRLEIDLGAEGCPAFGDGDQLPNEDLPRLGHEYVVQRFQQLVLALGGEQLDRHVVDVNDLHHRDGLLDEFRVGGEVLGKVAHSFGF